MTSSHSEWPERERSGQHWLLGYPSFALIHAGTPQLKMGSNFSSFPDTTVN